MPKLSNFIVEKNAKYLKLPAERRQLVQKVEPLVVGLVVDKPVRNKKVVESLAVESLGVESLVVEYRPELEFAEQRLAVVVEEHNHIDQIHCFDQQQLELEGFVEWLWAIGRHIQGCLS